MEAAVGTKDVTDGLLDSISTKELATGTYHLLLTAEDDYPAKANPIVDSLNEDTLYFQKE